MNRTLIAATVLASTMVFTAGCMTKKKVNAETAPIINKINSLDDRNDATTRGIHDLDDRSQQGIANAKGIAGQADQKAVAAGQQADQAQQQASSTSTAVEGLAQRVANLDNYHSVTQASVHFGFNKADLTKQDKMDLDQLATQIAATKGYIVVIEGSTDSVGNAQYNYALSQRRAAAVIQYLAVKYNVPPQKIYTLGLGKDKPEASNRTAKGRAENRRVDIRLMSNATGDQTATAAQ